MLFSIILLPGCLTTPPPLPTKILAALKQPKEITRVPFFPQQAYQCGPAALAMVLSWSGVNVTPSALVDQVYIPARKGSLQVEMLAAARRHGRIPYLLAPDMMSLLLEVQAGNPVLVFQNLGLGWYPKWHYAVAVGYDLTKNTLILRSGMERRRINTLSVFERTWKRAGKWAVVMVMPGQLPASAKELPYLRAVLHLENDEKWDEAAAAYQAALRHWPNSLGARMGLGNSHYALGRLPAAARAYHLVLQTDPTHAPAHNNLAQTLADLGQLPKAEHHATRAVRIGGPQEHLYRRTLDEIKKKLHDIK